MIVQLQMISTVRKKNKYTPFVPMKNNTSDINFSTNIIKNYMIVIRHNYLFGSVSYAVYAQDKKMFTYT